MKRGDSDTEPSASPPAEETVSEPTTGVRATPLGPAGAASLIASAYPSAPVIRERKDDSIDEFFEALIRKPVAPLASAPPHIEDEIGRALSPSVPPLPPPSEAPAAPTNRAIAIAPAPRVAAPAVPTHSPLPRGPVSLRPSTRRVAVAAAVAAAFLLGAWFMRWAGPTSSRASEAGPVPPSVDGTAGVAARAPLPHPAPSTASVLPPARPSAGVTAVAPSEGVPATAAPAALSFPVPAPARSSAPRVKPPSAAPSAHVPDDMESQSPLP